jgi:hypothetical protein
VLIDPVSKLVPVSVEEISGEAVPAGSLDGLPGHRRETLLWRYAVSMDWVAVDEAVRAAGTRPCLGAGVPGEGERLAVRGSDGRFHLLYGSKALCEARRKTVGPVPHTIKYAWWSDGVLYRRQVPASRPQEGTYQWRTVRWAVDLLGEDVAAAAVPTRQRCPIDAQRGYWPTCIDPSTPLGRIRRTLVDAFGPHCSTCRSRPGMFVDHEHFSGYVRGLLCNVCNTHVEDCLHLCGCPWADYLNRPPAAPMRLLYPHRDRDRRAARYKIELLGFDPFEPPMPFPWD